MTSRHHNKILKDMTMRSHSKSTIGVAIKQIRNLRDMTRNNLAEAALVTHQYISQLERGIGGPSAEVSDRIAAALEIPPETLYVLSLRDGTVRELNQPFIDALVRGAP